MSRQTEEHLRLAGVILLILVTVAAAPLVDDLIGFLSDAPYVQLLPLIVDRGADGGLGDVLTSAWNTITDEWCGRIPL